MKITCQTYEVWISSSWNAFVEFLQKLKSSRIGILVDDHTRKYCLPLISEHMKAIDYTVIEIPHGEKEKNLDTCRYIWQQMIKERFDRHSLLINLGGGVIGDMGGFCASTYMRGISFIQIPTTLLSQVDASVGSKLGIDFHHLKNVIGCFNNPSLVVIDPVFLKTLALPQVKSGFAEIIKHALIQDVEMWEQLVSKKGKLDFTWDELISKNVLIKKRIVEKDAREGGLRKILNFGHTIGHAVESHFLISSSPLLHGEAIAIGMICESYIGWKLNLLKEKQLQAITNYIIQLFPKKPSLNEAASSILEYLLMDKKNRGSKIMFSLLDNIGACHFNQSVPDKIVLESLAYFDTIEIKMLEDS